MKRRSWTRSLTAWVACVAILMAALLPSLSHAVAAYERGVPWMDICSTAAGTSAAAEHRASVDAEADIPGQVALHAAHCPFCTFHGAQIATRHSSSFGYTAIRDSAPRSLSFYQSPSPLFIWASAQSRAPPRTA